MQASGLKQNPFSMIGRFIAIVLFALCSVTCSFAQSASTPTTINITDTPTLKTAKRMGLVLGNQNFYDSGQFMRNLTFRNPGFEGEIWQTILHCQYVTATSCTDDDLFTYWPANFLAKAQAEFIVGAATGAKTTVQSSTAATIGSTGVTIKFPALATPPAVGDYVVVRMSVPGNAQAGWWTQGTSGTTFTTEFNDLSPNSPGNQALRITQGPSDQASVSSYMDSVPGRSFLQLNGRYTLSFRAKGTGGSNQVDVGFGRAVTGPPAVNYFSQTVTLTNDWKDYTFTFNAQDTGRVGTLSLKFSLGGSSMLLDDVSLIADAGPNNPTVYRDEVLATLQALQPGILRFMDSGTNWGSTFDNLIQPDFVRQRAGYSNHSSEMDDFPLNLHDYLVLCQTIGAEPWFTMPTGMTTQEMSDIIDYFGGSTSTPYGARRAALGQTDPWTTVFPKIHLEFGNEVWNTSNPGASMNDALSYGKRAGVIFTTAKNSPSYNAKVFDLIQDGWEALPSWTQQGLSTSTNYDTVDAAAYTFSNLFDVSSTEAIYGPMFAEPEAFNSTSGGIMDNIASVAAAANPPARVAIYEENMGTIQGVASQALLNKTVAGVGAGISTALNMLTLVRDLGITDQNFFALAGLTAPFTPSGGSDATQSPIWGGVIDMGGPTNLVRPTLLSEQLANTAILPTLLTSTQTGANPTWNQPFTKNDSFSLAGAHYIQNFAFTDGDKLNIILFNLSRTTALPVNFAGLNAPLGTASISTLTGPTIDTTNETQQNVTIKTTSQNLSAGSTLTLAPFSMTVVSVDAPLVPVQINSLTASCANASLSPGGSTTCTANVVGQGKYNPDVTWSVDNGSSGMIDSNGNYTAPSTNPPDGKAKITATSVQDTTKKVKLTILIADNTITGVNASCAVSSVGQGKQTTCTANVTGTGGFSPAYTWSTSAGSISANGLFTAPASGNTVTLTATSTQDPSQSDQVTLALTPVLIMGTPQGTATSTTATITWPLNMPAHSGISYGPSQAFGLSTPYLPDTTSNPNITLTNLKPGTTYYMAVYSFVNNQTVSQTFNVTTTTGSSTVTGVSISCPTVAGLSLGGVVPCTANVTGTGGYSSGVNWSVSAGSITSSGVLTAPLTGNSVTVTATSIQDATKSASINLSLGGQSTVTGVTVTCASTNVAAGATTTCAAPVTGTGSFANTVTWSTSAGSISQGGLVTAPASGTSFTVKATSTQDSSKYDTQIITVAPASTVTGISITCAAQSLSAGGTTTCGANLTGTGSFSSAVNWSTSAGTITPGGVLTAPNSGTSLTVTATSVQDSTKSASTTISLGQTLALSNPVISSTSTTVSVGWTLNIPAHSGVSYGATSSLGGSTPYDASLDSTPNFTLTGLQPSTTYNLVIYSFLNGQTVSKTLSIATTDSTTITGVAVNCGASSLSVNGTTTCSSTVTGTGNYSSGVTWSTSAGSISPSGFLTAPSSGSSVTVTATSTQDSTKSASRTIAIGGVVSSLGVTCNPTMAAGSTQTCTASVLGVGNYSSSVIWSTSAGSITQSGVLTAPTTGSSVTVYATSTTDASKIGVTTVSVTGVLSSLGVICPPSVGAGGTVTCNASALGLGNFSSSVIWSTSAGSITQSGVLTAPTSGSSVEVKVTSTVDASKVGVATVLINSNVSNVTVSCGEATVAASGTGTCSASVAGTGNFSSAVTWTTTAGSITPAGFFTAPAAGSLTIRATSVQNPWISGVRTIEVAANLAIMKPAFFATPTTIVVHWNVTQKAHSGISYGTSPHYGATTPYDNNLTDSPTYTFNGLKPGTTYYALLFSFNDNGTVTTPITITTPLK